MASSLNVRRGDRVKVITGKDKGKEGKVLRAYPREAACGRRGREHDQEAHPSQRRSNRRAASSRSRARSTSRNVMLVCPNCGAADAGRLVARGWRAPARRARSAARTSRSSAVADATAREVAPGQQSGVRRDEGEDQWHQDSRRSTGGGRAGAHGAASAGERQPGAAPREDRRQHGRRRGHPGHASCSTRRSAT